ncbi:MAG: hypothetical protein ABL962_12440 [Fimbriimonadaceae bacterium]
MRDNSPEVEEAFQRGYLHGLNKGNRAKARCLRLEAEVKTLRQHLVGTRGSMKAIIDRAKEVISEEDWEKVFGPRKRGQP